MADHGENVFRKNSILTPVKKMNLEAGQKSDLGISNHTKIYIFELKIGIIC